MRSVIEIVWTVAQVVAWTVACTFASLVLTTGVMWVVNRRRVRGVSGAERRVQQLLLWYPDEWRARYGDELAALLHDTIDDGRDGIRLTLDVAREGFAAHWHAARTDVVRSYTLAGAKRSIAATLLWSLCWIPLFQQGIAAMVMKLSGASNTSWFLALRAPDALQWPAIAGMVAVGLLTLAAAVRLSRGRAEAAPA
jgi:hypothetical protein